jgi:hypothetical protein
MPLSRRGELYSVRFDDSSSRCRFRSSESPAILLADAKASFSRKQDDGVCESHHRFTVHFRLITCNRQAIRGPEVLPARRLNQNRNSGLSSQR